MYFNLKINLNSLYKSTLTSSYPYTFYSCDENNTFLGLEYRYKFTKQILEKSFNISDTEIIKSQYFQLISKKIDEIPRDGGKDWIYAEPTTQAQRFIQTIKSIYKYGYLGKKTSKTINEFEISSHTHIEKNEKGNEKKINYLNRKYQGLIEVRRLDKCFIVLNGHHRLAILKAFKDLKIINLEKIKVKIYCRSFREFLKIFILYFTY
tara:strand:+ start:1792 stop:2412 length:621 start_codon:yes stop_codon:yes gene_type:complete